MWPNSAIHKKLENVDQWSSRIQVQKIKRPMWLDLWPIDLEMVHDTSSSPLLYLCHIWILLLWLPGVKKFWIYPPIVFSRPPHSNWRPPVIIWRPTVNNSRPPIIMGWVGMGVVVVVVVGVVGGVGWGWNTVNNWWTPQNNWRLPVIVWMTPVNKSGPPIIMWGPPGNNCWPPYNDWMTLEI